MEKENIDREEKLKKIKEYYPDVIKKKSETMKWDIYEKIELLEGEMLGNNVSWKESNTLEAKNKLEKRKAAVNARSILRKRLENIEEIVEDNIIYDFIYCIDCGKPIPINGRSTSAVKRCPECQAEYRRKYKAEKEKERRKKKKYNG